MRNNSFAKEFRFGNRMVGPNHPTLIIAEISANHNQKYEEAEAIVRAAADAGADVIKLQTYTPDTLTIDSDKPWFFLGGEGTPDSWKESNLYALYGKAYTPWEWQPKLKRLAESLGMEFFSTPFDETAVDFLQNMGVEAYKIASYEATHIPLIRYVAKTGKPVIMSVGFADIGEVEDAVEALHVEGVRKVSLLYCVTTYDNQPEYDAMNLGTIRDLAQRFGVVPGFSDNNAGIEFPVLAVALGACVVEKHLILDRARGGPDARFSLEPSEFKDMVKEIRKIEGVTRSVRYGPSNSDEENYKKLRRSIFVVKDIAQGEVFTKENIRVIRPAFGLAPKYFDAVLGEKATQDLERGTPLSFEHVKDFPSAQS